MKKTTKIKPKKTKKKSTKSPAQPKRNPYSHKGQNGRVLIIGGSKEYTGAVIFAGKAALKSGCDLVTIAAPEKVAWAINSYIPDLMTRKIKGEYITERKVTEVFKLTDKIDTILIGNGISLKSEGFVIKFVKKIKDQLKNKELNLVLDADAIKVANSNDLYNTIITPHEQEFEIFLNNNNKRELIRKLLELKLKIIKPKKTNKQTQKKPAKKDPENNPDDIIQLRAKLIQNNLKEFFENGNVILLKGKTDIIISKNKIFYNKTGNPSMTKGGTGDILAGLCAGYYSQTKDPFNSASLAAFSLGQIGDQMFKRYNYNYLTSDMLRRIKKLRK
ncbi:NAD(P)H-hydrate dehydratase [Nanoarchaeota archaeon]